MIVINCVLSEASVFVCTEAYLDPIRNSFISKS